MKAHRSSNSRFLLLACSLLIAGLTTALTAQTTAPKKAGPNQSALIAEVLRTTYGSTVEAASSFQPFYLSGDFNGDEVPDILVVVRITGQRANLPLDVKLYNPFERPKAVFPADPSANPTLALAIIHGGRPGWQTPPALEKFLLLGESPVLILNYGRITSAGPQDRENLMELMKKRARRPRGDAWPPLAAKGDSIVLGTEATDSILYWNGKNYRWEEAAGGE